MVNKVKDGKCTSRDTEDDQNAILKILNSVGWKEIVRNMCEENWKDSAQN